MGKFKNDEWVEYTGTIEAQSGKAVLFFAANWDEAQWVPRSQMEVIREDRDCDPTEYVIHVKKWLVEKNDWPQ